jgi:hypothetical protein
MTCFYINGKLLKRYCIENGISYGKCYYWLDKYGLSVEDAIKKVLSGEKKSNLKWDYNGESVFKYCEKHNLLYNSVVRAIKKGMSVDDAIKKARSLRHKRGVPAKYEYNGKSFRSICKEFGINYQTAHRWLKSGYSVEYVIWRAKNV